jgi:hypothetical protein
LLYTTKYLPAAQNSCGRVTYGIPSIQDDNQEIGRIHETRVIPLDGRPHLDQGVRQWFGDSRGHWEGDTLVVDVTNFNSRTRFEGSTQNMHLVERWRRVSDDQIDYRFTVSDPATWTKPWSAAIAWNKSGPVFEYACHEDNIDMYEILSVARSADKKAAAAAQKAAK